MRWVRAAGPGLQQAKTTNVAAACGHSHQQATDVRPTHLHFTALTTYYQHTYHHRMQFFMTIVHRFTSASARATHCRWWLASNTTVRMGSITKQWLVELASSAVIVVYGIDLQGVSHRITHAQKQKKQTCQLSIYVQVRTVEFTTRRNGVCVQQRVCSILP